MAKQLKKFCRITKYIENTDPKLHEILDDLCVLGSFRPRRGHNGITFLWPSKETVAKLDKMRYTEDIEKAVDIVLAHIVHDYLPSAAAWTQKKSDIPNGLNKKLEVKEVKGSKVVLADGAELEHDAKFKTFSRGEENQAVWEVKKGNIDPSKHTKQASFEHARQGPRQGPRPHAAMGGALPAGLLKKHLGYLSEAASSKSKVTNNDLFCHMVDFLGYLDDKVQDSAKSKIAAYIVSPLPISSYAFLASEKSPLSAEWESFLADDSAKSGAYGYTQYLTRIAEFRSANGVTGGMKTRQDVIDSLNKIIADAQDKTREWLKEAGVDIDAEFMSNLNLARMSEAEMLKQLRNDHTLREQDARELVADVADAIHDFATGNSLFTNSATQKLGVLAIHVFQHVEKFVNSPYFQYPFKRAAEVDGPATDILKSLYTDTSVQKTLNDMPGEAAAKLFGSLSGQSERPPTTEENADEE